MREFRGRAFLRVRLDTGLRQVLEHLCALGVRQERLALLEDEQSQVTQPSPENGTPWLKAAASSKGDRPKSGATLADRCAQRPRELAPHKLAR